MCPDTITEEQLIKIFTGIASEGKYKDSHMEWIKVSYAIIKTCELSGFENRAADLVDQFSQLGTSGSYDANAVQHLINGYKYEFPVDNPVSWLLQNYLPKQSATRDEFLQNVTTQYYYKDYTKFAQQRVDLDDIREYCK